MNLLKSELLKLKRCWLLRVSFLLALLLPFLTLAMTLLSEQARQSAEPQFLMLIRQNHIFLTLFACNLLSSLIVTHLFLKEFQYGTIADIISVPVGRMRYIAVKEAVLFFWMMAIGLFSYLLCLLIGAVFGLTGFTFDLAVTGLWKYAAATAISFIPMQLMVLATLLFKNYAISLAISAVMLVGSVVAFNTKDLIFVFPYSIAFVLTNFQTPITGEQALASAASLAALLIVCLLGILIRFSRMDLKTVA